MIEPEWPEPAYTITSERLVIRCFERGDVGRVHQTVLDNVEALRPWMPWIEYEPMKLEQRAEVVRGFRARFDAGEDFIYGIFDPRDDRYLGGCGLHPRISPHGLEIGYWIVHDRWGEGLATEAAAALTRVAIDRMEADRVEIRVSPRNPRSAAVPRKLGFVEEGTLQGVGPYHTAGPDMGLRDDLIVFGMLPHQFPTSAAAEVAIEVEGFDCGA